MVVRDAPSPDDRRIPAVLRVRASGPGSLLQRLDETASQILQHFGVQPSVAVILGSGLGDFTDSAPASARIPYRELTHFPLSGVEGHSGEMVCLKQDSSGRPPTLILRGRSHLYEGLGLSDVVFPVRVLGRMGVRTLVLTNAAGGVDPDLNPGTLMLISDHINLMGDNPLRGANLDSLGPRFPDMTEVYSERLRALAKREAQNFDLTLPEGVYAACLGPSYETPSEVRMLRTMGASAVGMSTVPEAIVARHMGIEVLGISCISNLAAGLGRGPLSHHEVLETSARVQGVLERLLEELLPRLGEGETPRPGDDR